MLPCAAALHKETGYIQAEEVKKGGITSGNGVWDTSIPVVFLTSQKHMGLESSSGVNSTSVKRGEKSIPVFLVWASIANLSRNNYLLEIQVFRFSRQQKRAFEPCC